VHLPRTGAALHRRRPPRRARTASAPRARQPSPAAEGARARVSARVASNSPWSHRAHYRVLGRVASSNTHLVAGRPRGYQLRESRRGRARPHAAGGLQQPPVEAQPPGHVTPHLRGGEDKNDKNDSAHACILRRRVAPARAPRAVIVNTPGASGAGATDSLRAYPSRNGQRSQRTGPDIGPPTSADAHVARRARAPPRRAVQACVCVCVWPWVARAAARRGGRRGVVRARDGGGAAARARSAGADAAGGGAAAGAPAVRSDMADEAPKAGGAQAQALRWRAQ
jgi:hypothetical protein